MVVFLSDLFNDTDGTLLQNHSPGTGGAWGKLDSNYFGDVPRGNATIQSNGVMDRSDFYRNAADPGSAEYTILGDITVGTGNNNSSNAYNYFGARMTPTGTAYADVDMYIAGRDGGTIAGTRGWRLAKIVGGTLTLLDSPNINPDPGTYSLEFEVTDASKALSVNGSPLLSTADNDITQNGRVGLNVGREGGRMEDIAAETSAAFDLASLFATGTQTIADVVNEADNTTDLHLSVDDDPATPTDTDWVNNAVDVT